MAIGSVGAADVLRQRLWGVPRIGSGPRYRSNSASRRRSSSVSPPRASSRSGRRSAGAGEGLGPAPAGDAGVVARAQHLGHLPAPELGRAGVVRVLEQPVAEGLVVDRRPRCPSRRAPAGRRPRGPPWPPPRRRRARSRRSTARRRPGARGPARRRPRSGRRAGRSRRRRPARGPRPGRGGARPGPRRAAGRGGSTASTAAKTGSGMSTIPAPPPNGRVVDRAVHVGGGRPQVVDPDVERRRRPAPCRAGARRRTRAPSRGRS